MQNCDPVKDHEIENVGFDAVRAGITTAADRRFVLVPAAPIGMVEYYADSVEINKSTCGDALLLGPLNANQKVWVAVDELRSLLILRAVVLIIGSVTILAPARFTWRLFARP